MVSKVERELGLLTQHEQGDVALRACVAGYEELERLNGLDLDVLTDIFGVQALESEMLLERFTKLYEALGEPNKKLFVGSCRDVLRPGCYGFGARPVYDRKITGMYFDDTSCAEVECRPGKEPSIVLRGVGYCVNDELWAKPEKAEPAEFMVAGLARYSKTFTEPIMQMNIIETGDKAADIGAQISRRYEQIGQPVSYVGWWLLRNSPEAHR